MMDNEQPHQELVKCVVVGDTAVGKTRLICARACNKHVSLSQLLTTHVPTVWAIDQYRIYKDVLERSWEVVDGVNVSLRLWDTFGDHEKDRRFAYGRSDVVLLCFSVGSAASLRHCRAMWFPEIRRFCPQTPVLLVGCKSDLRYMYRDETYLSFCRDRSPFVRPTRACDLVLPEQARALAKELGVPYYETSVLSYHGVNEAFENAIRAALCARRQQRFWMTNLKRVRRPLLQAPFCPPAPPPPSLHVCGPLLEDHLHALWVQQAHTDVVLVAGGVGFSAHRFLLAAASPAFHRLLTLDLSSHLGGLHRSPSTPSLTSESTSEDPEDDMERRWLLKPESSGKECSSDECMGVVLGSSGGGSNGAGSKTLRFWEQLKSRMGCLAGADSSRRPGVSRELDHPAFRSIRLERRSGPDPRGRPTASLQTVVTLSKLVTAQAMHQCLQFLYTGNLEPRFCEIQEIRQAAEFIDLPELLLFVSNVQAHEEFLNTDLRQRYRQALRNRLQEMCLDQGLFSDVLFQLDDGVCAAHRPLLMAACDVMKAMFSGHFRESSAKVVVFPGVREETFRHLLCYLYTDRCPGVTPGSCLALLELANRLCLPRLVQLVEERVVQELERASDMNGDVVEECLRLLEPCQIHNAEQLAEWCIHHLATNYNAICKKSPKMLRSLHPENQAYLNEHRWPPVWYLKDYDYYLKCLLEREKEDNKKPLKRSRNNSGCLCFTGKSRRDESTPSSTYHAV